MRLPFSRDQFFEVFTRYNQAVWPAQVMLLVVAAMIVLATVYRRRRVAAGLLALLWAWMAVAYHFAMFSNINSMAYVFAIAFVTEATLLGAWASRSDAGSGAEPLEVTAGSALIAYALFAYPAIAWILGQRYPSTPTFGVPCPTTIFTLGVFCFFIRQLPAYLLVVPIAWAFVSLSAAVQLGVVEDFGLVAGALATTVLWGSARRRTAQREVLP
jgi:hypothetical protein